MKLYCSLLLIGLLLWNNSVQAQDLERTYRVQANTFVKEVDTNMVQSKHLKYLSKDYLAKVVSVTNDSVYMLCYFDDRFTNTEFGLQDITTQKMIYSDSTNYLGTVLNKAAQLYKSKPTLSNAFKMKVAELNLKRLNEFNKGTRYNLIIFDTAKIENEALII